MSTGETVSMAPGEFHPTSRPEPTEFPCEFGGYRLLGLLGQGGMGSVYEAEQVPTSRRVALKMLGRQLDSPDMRQRFLREGRLAAGVSHPNSLYVFGSEEIDGVPVITMEIADSGTLQDQLEKRGPFPVPEAVDAILDAITGLEAAFAAGVLHRDIKPSNCFVSPDGSVKIGDFGLSVSTMARDNSYVTAAGVILGTPAYASPEQLRGDPLDVRADIYSVGATLFTLLTGRAPFEGANVLQVVAHAVNQRPKRLTELRPAVPTGLERVVTCCLAKEPDGRFANYQALRKALLPYSSQVPEPASIKVRASAGWIDYLIAFMVPYVILMLFVGAEALLIQPVVEHTLYSARYYLAIFGFGFLYFGLAEGIWGAGLGKRLKGLRVVRSNDRPPGIGRALIRILIPILSVEGIRMPLMMATISDTALTGPQVAWFVIAANLCGWIPVLLTWRARRENGFSTVWDRLSGTRVVLAPESPLRPSITPVAQPEVPAEGAVWLGPYRIVDETVPGSWMVAVDPLLRRQVWLIRQEPANLPPARRNLTRPGRLRWLQKVEAAGTTWNAFEATPGVSFSSLVENWKRVPWSSLRYWLHDLASELLEATKDQTLPDRLSLDHIWITTQGRAVLLDAPWPAVEDRAEPMPVGDFAGQQRFLNTVAACVEPTSVPLHARSVLQKLQDGRLESLTFLTDTLGGLLNRPTEVSRGLRAGSIFMLPLFIWTLVFLGYYQGERVGQWQDSLGTLALISMMGILAAAAMIQLLELPFRTTVSYSIFRLAVVNAKGGPAGPRILWIRWAITWVPLFLPLLIVLPLTERGDIAAAFVATLIWLLLWTSVAVCAVVSPNRGLHDRLAGTWLVRR